MRLNELVSIAIVGFGILAAWGWNEIVKPEPSKQVCQFIGSVQECVWVPLEQDPLTVFNDKKGA